ncbi:MAG TPA: HEAT repeat domain-containing protein [Nitrospirales bacterium]|jgi:HEAT repeat protein|nr:HEAT repeat domain-containing protein [Nitrospirales bacterium]
MAEDVKKTEDAGQAKAKPVETTSAMPDGSDKSEYMPTGPEQPVAEAEAPAAPAVEEVKAPEEKVKDEVEIQIDLMKDKDWYHRREAAITLGEMGDERAIPHLIVALRDSEWNVREAAEDALAQIGSPAVEPLIKALREYQIRKFVIKILGKIKDERVLDPLFAQFRNEEFKDAAAQALVEVGQPAVERLTAVLNDKDKNVRKHAIIALGDIGVTECVDLLIEATKDEEWEVRLAAIAALDKIGDARGKPAIKALMKDPDFVVQMRAERIILEWKKKAQAAKEVKDEEETEERAGKA